MPAAASVRDQPRSITRTGFIKARPATQAEGLGCYLPAGVGLGGQSCLWVSGMFQVLGLTGELSACPWKAVESAVRSYAPAV